MAQQLPLFPLGTALLPGQRLPLTIFEPRYVDLIHGLVERPEQERCFGVVGIRRGQEVGADAVRDLYAVGCEARIDAIAATVGFGEPRYQLVATGTRRFLLQGLVADGATPYLVGEVAWLPVVPPPSEAEVRRMRRGLAAFCIAVGLPLEELPPGVPDVLARVVGSVPTLGAADRQAVLVAETTMEQTEVVLRLLRREVALIRGLGAVRWFEPPAPSAN